MVPPVLAPTRPPMSLPLPVTAPVAKDVAMVPLMFSPTRPPTWDPAPLTLPVL